MTVEYAAFLSYSRRDIALAQKLQRDLERLRVPATLVGIQGRNGIVPNKVGKVFLDKTDLAAAPDITDELARNLQSSRALIVLCSNSAANPNSWVGREIAAYRRLRPGGPIFAVIGKDEPPGCFPIQLRAADGAASDAEPLAADMRLDGDGPKEAVVKLAAGLLGVPFDDLRRRRGQAERRRRAFLIATIALYALAITAALAWAANTLLSLRDSRRIAIAAQAQLENDRGRYDLGLLLSATALVHGNSLVEKSPSMAKSQALRALANNRTERWIPSEGAQTMTVDEQRNRVYAARYRRQVRALHLPDGRPVEGWQSPKENVGVMALEPVSGNLAIATVEGEVVVVEPEAGAQLARSSPSGVRATSLAFSRDGNRLVVGGEDGYARIFDVRKGQWLVTSPPHNDVVMGAAFSYDGSRILSGGWNGKLLEWSVESGSPVAREYEYMGTITDVRALDLTSWVVEFAIRQEFVIIPQSESVDIRKIPLENPGSSASMSKDGGHILSASSDAYAQIIDAFTGDVIWRLVHPSWVDRASFFDNEERILTLSRDGFLRVWSNDLKYRPKFLYELPDDGPSYLGWSPILDGFLFAGGNGLAIIDRTGKAEWFGIPTCDPKLKGVCINDFTASPSGEHALLATDAGEIFAFDLRRKQFVWSDKVKDRIALHVIYSPDGKRFGVRGSKGVEIRNAQDGRVQATYSIDTSEWELSKDDHSGISFDPTGRFIIETGVDYVQIRDLDDLTIVWKKPVAVGNALSVAWSPDGKKIAVGTHNHYVMLFSAFSDAAPAVLRKHRAWVLDLAFSPDTRFLVSTSSDEHIIWDVENAKDLMQIETDKGLPSAAMFFDGGKSLAVANSSGILRTLPANWPIIESKEDVCGRLPPGRSTFLRSEMAERDFLHDDDRDPCDRPTFPSWDWIGSEMLKWGP